MVKTIFNNLRKNYNVLTFIPPVKYRPNQCKCILIYVGRIMKKNIESNIVLAFNKMSFDKMYTGKC